jgi:hypothetical protein
LFYVAPDMSVTAVPIDSTGQFHAGQPQARFQFRSGAPTLDGSQVYALMKDGKRFLVNARPAQTSVAALTVVINWPATIQK